MSSAALREQVRAAIAPVVADAGYDLEDVELTPAGSRRVLKVVVDRDGGIDLDAVAEVARLIDVALESDGANGPVLGSAPYVLEVTSPGVDRPLTEPRHWRRAISRLVEVEVAGAGRIRGRVRAADDDVVQIEVSGELRAIPFTALGKGKVQVEFGPVKDGATS